MRPCRALQDSVISRLSSNTRPKPLLGNGSVTRYGIKVKEKNALDVFNVRKSFLEKVYSIEHFYFKLLKRLSILSHLGGKKARGYGSL